MASIIAKTHKDSYFQRFNIKSPLANKLFDKFSDTIILQMMDFGGGEIIAEVVNRSKYEVKQ